MKKNLLTIGDVAKRTGSSIKSLRYYDSIGILKPAYIDPDTNYRYYTFEQTRMVEIIQFCILLDINLKDVKSMIFKDDKTMDYSNLIDYGRKITKEKILKLQQNLTILDDFQSEIERLDSYGNDDKKDFHFPEKYFYITPLLEDEMNDNYYKLLDTAFTYVLNEEFSLKNDYGVIMDIDANTIHKFAAIEVDKKHKDLENVVKVNEGHFLCRKTSEFNLLKIADMFSEIKPPKKTIIITTGYSYDFSNHYFEAKCSL